MEEVAAGALVVARTRVAIGSAFGSLARGPGCLSALGSAGRYSIGLGSSGNASACGGRGRGSGLVSGSADGTGNFTTVPNIGDG